MAEWIYSYIIPVDDGAAPNPFGGICTLTICKPAIRRGAKEGHWVIGTGSKHTKLPNGSVRNYSNSLVYAMKVTDKKSLKDYDNYCKSNLQIKIPNTKSKIFEKQVGDCIYDYSTGKPVQRDGVHGSGNIETDLNGKNALLSNHFYYFGSRPELIPGDLRNIIHTTQNCKLIKDKEIIERFEAWISQYKLNLICADPQQKNSYNELGFDACKKGCSSKRLKNNCGPNDSIC